MRNSNKIIIFDYKIEESHTELDLDLLEKQFPGYSDDDNIDNYPQIYRKGNKKMYWSGETEAIEIAKIEKLINKCKRKNCTHLEINYHGDHKGYYFYGIQVCNANKNDTDEINMRIDILNKNELKKHKIELEKEIQRINKIINE